MDDDGRARREREREPRAIPLVADPPALIDGRFERLGTLGRGGMGVVYRVRDRERGVELALKTVGAIRPSPEALLRFKQEFRPLRDLRHPNLVELGELFEADGTWYFTMALVRGVPFNHWVRAPLETADRARSSTVTGGPLTARDAATVIDVPASVAGRHTPPAERRGPRRARPACDEGRLRAALAGLARGLVALHAAGKVHRDIKPSNILVEPDGRVVLLDFGLVAELHTGADAGKLLGTIEYMAPEQARGEPVGPAADWYAVGVILFEALTGQLPFIGFTRDELLAIKQRLLAPAPRELAAGVPVDLDRLCGQLLDPDATRRPVGAALAAQLDVEADAAAAWPAAADDRGVFVGRDAELAALDDALAASRAGAVGIVVEGESGVGKSALVERFLATARGLHPRLVVLRGRCHERERVPYNAVDGIIDELARFLLARREATTQRLVPSGIAALVSVFPALRAVPSFRTAAVLEGTAPATDVRGRSFAALRELVARLGEVRPVVLAIDDVQWADGDSAALIDELVRGPAPPPILVVATARPDDRHGAVARLLAAAPDARRLALAGLDPDDAAALVHLVTDGVTADHAAAIVAA